MLVCPLIRICMPYREHLVVVAGDLGHRNRRSPTHAPATFANLIWSFHLNTSLKSSSPSASANRTEIGTAREGESESNGCGQSLPGTCPDVLYSVLAKICSSPYWCWSVSQGPCGRSYRSRKQTLQARSRPEAVLRPQQVTPVVRNIDRHAPNGLHKSIGHDDRALTRCR